MARFTAATLVMPWFHHCALTLRITRSSSPTNFPMPPSFASAESTFSAGVPPCATAMDVRSRTGSCGTSGGVALNDGNRVLLARVPTIFLRRAKAAPPMTAMAPPATKTRRERPILFGRGHGRSV